MSSYKEKTDADIRNEVKEKRELLRQFRFGVSGSKTRNVREGRAYRREIARMLTELSARIGKTK